MASRGRPSKFTKAIATRICERLAAGETLRSVCRLSSMPAESTVRAWALDDLHGFSAQYARAREIGYHGLFDEMLEIADTTQEGVKTVQKMNGTETTTGDMIEHRRLRVDTRKWMLSKALPKIYGDKMEHSGPNGGPIITEMIDRPPDETREQWVARREKEMGRALGATAGPAN